MPMTLQIKVKPRARASSLLQEPDGTWVASLKSPPVDGKANAELVVLVAKQFRCGKGDVKIKSGANGRLKRVLVDTETFCKKS